MSPGTLDLQTRVVGAYIGLAIGDALGSTVEFMTPREIKHQIGIHSEIRGGGWLNLKAGQVTDDTEMSLALGNSILNSAGVEARSVADHFDQWMKSKPIDIGNTVRRNLVAYRTSGVPCAQPSEHDAGNGAAMRVLPVAIAYRLAPVAAIHAAAITQAHTTHNNPLSDAACEFLVDFLHMVWLEKNLDEITRTLIQPLVHKFPQFNYESKQTESPSGYIVDTLKAVLQSFLSTGNFESCLIDVVNRGGDADTTGAISGMLAGAFYGTGSIPKRWIKKLNAVTKAQCETQACALLTLSHRLVNAG